MKEPHNHPSIDRVAELQQLIANFANVKRTNKLISNDGLENDVEHSYGLAMTCWFLQPYIAPELDINKIIRYALAHDLVELYSGDYYFMLTPEQQQKKKEGERKALQRLSSEWKHDFPELINTVTDYEEKIDEETWFVYAVDKLLPTIMINLHEKEEYYTRWKLKKEPYFQKKRETISKSKHMAVYIERFLDWVEERDYFYKEEA